MYVQQAGKIGSKGETNSYTCLKTRFLGAVAVNVSAVESWQSVAWVKAWCA